MSLSVLNINFSIYTGRGFIDINGTGFKVQVFPSKGNCFVTPVACKKGKNKE